MAECTGKVLILTIITFFQQSKIPSKAASKFKRILCKSKFSSEPKTFEVKNAINHAFVVNVF